MRSTKPDRELVFVCMDSMEWLCRRRELYGSFLEPLEMAGQLIKFSKEKNALQINYCASLTQNHSWKNANDQKRILPLLSVKKKFTIIIIIITNLVMRARNWVQHWRILTADWIQYIPIWYCITYVEAYALCIMQYAFKITAYHGGFGLKLMHYEKYALSRYALWASQLYLIVWLSTPSRFLPFIRIRTKRKNQISCLFCYNHLAV